MRIVPFESAAGIRFGTPRSVVRSEFGTSQAFRRAAWQTRLTDHYPALGLFVGYGDDDTVDEIELYGPARPSVAGIDLLATPSQQVVKALTDAGAEVRLAPHLWAVPSWGITMSVQGPGVAERPFTSVACTKSAVEEWPRLVSWTSPERSGPPSMLDPEGFGELRLDMPMDEARALLGAGTTSLRIDGRRMDLFFDPRVAVTYTLDDRVQRICVLANGTATTVAPVTVGMSFDDCLRALRDAGHAITISEAELHLPESGLYVRSSRAGDASLPVSSMTVER